MINVEIASSGRTLEIDWNKLPEAAKNYIIAYGLKQRLNDAGASIKKEEDDWLDKKIGAAESVLENLYKGLITVRVSRGGLTPIERAFNKIVKAYYKKLFKSTLDEDTSIKDAVAAIAGKLGKDVETLTDAITAKAEAEVELQEKVAALKAELPDIAI